MELCARVAFCVALWCAGVSAAMAASYQVEVIVFAYLQPDSDGEQWIENAGLPERDRLVLLGTAGGESGAAATLLPSSSYRLNGLMGALRRAGRYRPLLHTSWLQVDSGRNRGVFLSAPGTDGGTDPGVAAATEVQGSVTLRVTRFLHVDVDMAYFPGFATQESMPPPDAAPASPADGPEHVRLQESRRIKLNEVHYFDHPLFGLLLQVSRAGGEDDSPHE